MKLHNVLQGSEDWHNLRLEFPFTSTSSQAVASMGKGIQTHIKNKLLIIYGLEEDTQVWTPEIQRGIELETEAIQAYEIETGTLIDEVGFVTNSKYPLAGDSPDGMTKDGIIEAKCLTEKKYLKFKEDRKIPSKYQWQVQWHLLITEKDWCDFFLYHPEHGVEIERVYPDKKKQDKLKKGLEYAVALWDKEKKYYD